MKIVEINGIITLGDVKRKDIIESQFIVPKEVTAINEWAFFDCRNLTQIMIYDCVTSIGKMAFRNCSSLTHLTMPNSVTFLGNGAFWSCDELTSIVISHSLTSINEGVFGCCKSLSSIALPNSVTSIHKYAFLNCDHLTHILIPDSMIFIDAEAFKNCPRLNHIIIETENINRFNTIKALLPREFRDKVIEFNIIVQMKCLKKQLLMDAALACHPLESLPSSRHLNFLVQEVLHYDTGHSLKPVYELKKEIEAVPITCHTQEEFETYKQQLKGIYFKFQLHITHQHLKSYLEILQTQISPQFFSTTPKLTKNKKTLAFFVLLNDLIDSLERGELVKISEEKRHLLCSKPLLLSKIPREVQYEMGIVADQSDLKLRPI